MFQVMPITRIFKSSFKGDVFNLELKSNDETKDDLFWVEASTGIITHNCLPKDLANLISCMGVNSQDSPVCAAALQRNAHDRARTPQ